MSLDPIRAYLQQLNALLPGNPLRRRRILRELEDHLRDATTGMEEKSSSHEQAVRTAIEQLGSPEDLARQFRAQRSTSWFMNAPRLGALLVAAAAVATAAALIVDRDQPNLRSPRADGSGGLGESAPAGRGEAAEPGRLAADVPANVRVVEIRWAPAAQPLRPRPKETSIVATDKLAILVSIENVGATQGRGIPVRLTLRQETITLNLEKTIASLPAKSIKIVSFGPRDLAPETLRFAVASQLTVTIPALSGPVETDAYQVIFSLPGPDDAELMALVNQTS